LREGEAVFKKRKRDQSFVGDRLWRLEASKHGHHPILPASRRGFYQKKALIVKEAKQRTERKQFIKIVDGSAEM
jgi:hypothetical protein